MAFPQVETSTSVSETTNATAHTATYPTGIAAGDLILVLAGMDGTTAFSWPMDFTEIIDDSVGGGGALGVAWKKATGSESGTFEITTAASEKGGFVVLRISGAADPDVQPPEISAAASNNSGTNDSPNSASLTPTGGIKDYLWITCYAHDNSNTVSAYPSNYTDNQFDKPSSGGADGGFAMASRELNASSENPGAFTMSAAETWIAYTIAIHPSTSGFSVRVSIF